MGTTTEASAATLDAREVLEASVSESQDSGDWYVDFDETESVDLQSPPSPTPEWQLRGRPSSAPSQPDTKPRSWALPLESLVLEAPRDISLPLSFLNVYPSILRKFPGPPIEALGRTISYLQALFTESPGFHPFITHLPTEMPPANDVIGKRVAEELERRLIRIVQHLFSFFYGDVGIVKQYLNECRAELVPRPLFILSTPQPSSVVSTSPSPSERMVNGVQGYNNGVECGAELWQSPVTETVWTRHVEHQAMQENIRKCITTINRKKFGNALLGQQPQQRTPLQSFPPLPTAPPPPPLLQQAPPQFSPPPPPQFQLPFGPPNQAGQISPITPLRPPQPPQIFHVQPPPIHQMQLPAPNQVVPQPNFGPPPPPAPISAPTQMVQPPPHTMPIITRSASAPGQSFKDDINRLETQMSRLLQLVESKSRP